MSESVYKKLITIQNELNVPKNSYNNHGKYYFRSAEDILEAVKPIAKKYNCSVHITEEIKSVESINEVIVYIDSVALLYDIDSKEFIKANGTAIIDLDSKVNMQKPQRTGSASSYAKKYALGNLFMIDDTKDSDATNTHGKDDKKVAPKTPPVGDTKKAMSDVNKTKLLKAIGEGKFSVVESYLKNYRVDDNSKAVEEALSKAKAGK